ncbi:MAG: hypothetical protein WAO20_21560 [Acidobacteriota bacterium]
MHFRQLRRCPGFAVSVVLGWLVLAAPCLAGSTLIFPRLSYETGTYTGIAIANPTAVAAQITLTAYGADGTLLSGSGVANPVQITIEPHRQFARTSYELFGAGLARSTVAWFKAESPVEGLTGFFLFLNGSITFFDGADLPEQSRDLVFNLVRLGDGWSTELNLVNPGTAGTTVELTLRGGATALSRSLTLSAKGAARVDVATLFEQDDPPPNGSIVASAGAPLVGFELVRGPGDLLGLNARPLSETLNTLFFPQVAVLGEPAYESELAVVNYGEENAILTISAYQPEGLLFGSADVRNNPVTRVLGRGAVLCEDAAQLFGFKGAGLRTGWIKVQATSPSINGSLSYFIPAWQSAAAVASEPRGRTHALFSHLATTYGYFTGVAVLNGGSQAANIRLVALDKEGARIGTYTGVLRPGEQLSRLITELVPGSEGRDGGMIWATSDVPVYMTGLFVNTEHGVLTNVPPQPVPESFLPDAGQPRLLVSPRLAVTTPGQFLTFHAEGAGGPVNWNVSDGPAGGTVSSLGIYHSPVEVPAALPVTVSASSDTLVAAASVDILHKQQLVGGLGVIQSVAYLSGLRQLYAAELLAAGGLRVAAAAGSSRILDVTGQAPAPVKTFEGEEIAKMIPLLGADSREYLLLAGKTGGRIIRLDPASGQSVDVATGLNAPSALVIDPVTGDLLVAEADRVRSIPRAQLESGLGARRSTADGGTGPGLAVDLDTGGDGIAVDPCTGRIYVSSASQGAILSFDRVTAEWEFAATGLNSPGSLLVVYREGFSCPEAFHLLVAERGLNRVLLVTPSDGGVRPWVSAPGITDLAFLPKDSPFYSGAGVLTAEAPAAGGGQIALTEIPGLYSDILINPPVLTLESASWSTTTPLPVARLLAAAAAPGNGYLYSIGGYPESTACSIGRGDGRVFLARQNADGTLGPWQETEGGGANFVRVASGVATDSGYIYVAGGAVNAPSWDGYIWFAKPGPEGQISAWSRSAPLPGSPNWLGSWPIVAAYEGYLYVGGGRNAFTPRYTDRLYYARLNANGSPGPWTQIALPSPSFQGQLNFYAGRAYLVLGTDNCDGCISDRVFTAVVEPQGGLGPWQEARSLPEPARQASAQVVDGHLVVLPGGTAVYESAILPDGSLGPWNSMELLPESALPWAQGVYADGYYYLVGDQNCGATDARLRKVYFGRIRF